MAVMVPILAAAGGGSAVLGGTLLGATALSGGLAAYGQYQAGQAASAQYRAQARQEQTAARESEIQRRRDLLRALATQNAQAGAQRVAFSGGKAAIAAYDVAQAKRDTLVAQVNSSTKIAALKSAASNAAFQGKVGAAASLLDTATNITKTIA